ncbi:MAG: Plug domain-containing protein [Hyphomicrobium sp.]
MTKSRLATLLLLTTALAVPLPALAQDAPPQDPAPADAQAEPAQEEAVDVSLPGEIIVTGTKNRNPAMSSDQVISVLSNAEIARTGEGNIAGALGRVTGLTIVGSGFVYVRGLGDRYSLAPSRSAALFRWIFSRPTWSHPRSCKRAIRSTFRANSAAV